MLIVIAATCVMFAGCSDDEASPSATSPAPEADVCEAQDPLRRSLEGLTDLDVPTDGTGDVEAAIDGVRKDLDVVDLVGDKMNPRSTR